MTHHPEISFSELDMKILIVEDDPVVRGLLGKYVSAFGEPVFALDGPAGRKLFAEAMERKEYFALALVDIGLPGEDGLDLLAAIRLFEKENDLSSMPVIMVTGSEESADIAQAESFGIFAYIVKPIDPDVLKEQLRVALSIKS